MSPAGVYRSRRRAASDCLSSFRFLSPTLPDRLLSSPRLGCASTINQGPLAFLVPEEATTWVSPAVQAFSSGISCHIGLSISAGGNFQMRIRLGIGAAQVPRFSKRYFCPHLGPNLAATQVESRGCAVRLGYEAGSFRTFSSRIRDEIGRGSVYFGRLIEAVCDPSDLDHLVSRTKRTAADLTSRARHGF